MEDGRIVRNVYSQFIRANQMARNLEEGLRDYREIAGGDYM